MCYVVFKVVGNERIVSKSRIQSKRRGTTKMQTLHVLKRKCNRLNYGPTSRTFAHLCVMMPHIENGRIKSFIDFSNHLIAALFGGIKVFALHTHNCVVIIGLKRA